MASDYIDCKQIVRPRQEAIQFNGCEKWQHLTCGSLISRDLFIVPIICLNKLFKLCVCLYFHKCNKLAEISLNIETHFVEIFAITNNIIHK